MQTKLLNKKVGVYFGSFNPIHIGHLVVAEKALEDTDLDEVWFCVSPQNPHKRNHKDVEDENERLEMVKKAIKNLPGLSYTDVEFRLPKPSYTHEALRVLREENPETQFSIIAGTDTQHKIGRWRSSAEILEHHDIIVYPRVMSVDEQAKWPLTDRAAERSRYLNDVPVLEISATYIRKQINSNKTIRHLVPDVVIDHINENGLFKK